MLCFGLLHCDGITIHSTAPVCTMKPSGVNMGEGVFKWFKNTPQTFEQIGRYVLKKIFKVKI